MIVTGINRIVERIVYTPSSVSTGQVDQGAQDAQHQAHNADRDHHQPDRSAERSTVRRVRDSGAMRLNGLVDSLGC